MEEIERLFFGEEHGENFRLETRRDPQGRLHMRLFRGNVLEDTVKAKTLEFLRYIAKRAKRDLYKSDLYVALWPNSQDPQIVETYVRFARTALGDVPGVQSKYIKTIHGEGYRFACSVRKEGDLDAIQAYSEWNPKRFGELLGSIQRGNPGESEDLRIVTTGVSGGLEWFNLNDLLRRKVRIRMIFLDPGCTVLADARYSLRKDKLKARCLKELGDQILEASELAAQHQFPQRPLITLPAENRTAASTRANDQPDDVEEEIEGAFEFAVSRLMPCGFVALTKNWALLGIFLANQSFVYGPMFIAHSGTHAWDRLESDWQARWNDVKERGLINKLPDILSGTGRPL